MDEGRNFTSEPDAIKSVIFINRWKGVFWDNTKLRVTIEGDAQRYVNERINTAWATWRKFAGVNRKVPPL